TALLCMLFIIACASAQKVVVTGKVSDDKGNTIPSASIKEKNTKNGVTADNNGTFRINVSPGAKLIISATGYTTMEVAASSVVNVELVIENKSLSEVVVTAQGIRRRPKELGFSVAKVSNADLTTGRAPQIAAGLSGKVSGLVVI